MKKETDFLELNDEIRDEFLNDVLAEFICWKNKLKKETGNLEIDEMLNEFISCYKKYFNGRAELEIDTALQLEKLYAKLGNTLLLEVYEITSFIKLFWLQERSRELYNVTSELRNYLLEMKKTINQKKVNQALKEVKQIMFDSPFMYKAGCFPDVAIDKCCCHNEDDDNNDD